MKISYWVFPVIAILAGLSVSTTSYSFEDGSCPSSNNACTNDDGCPILQQTTYIDWIGMKRCTFGLGSCENSLSLLCKKVYSCFSGCGAIIDGPNDVHECGCEGNGYPNPVGHAACYEGTGR